ncbi:hypothetical protein LC612_31455 [Nostoc sp. CHAB 5834]|nr:hypothetical protein [Nostoc sp. CHAB 5834]
MDQQLLVDEYDIKLLSSIEIHDENFNHREEGKWLCFIDKASGDLGGKIRLNYQYLKTLDDLKETLAHEYGHHWSIINCIRHHWPNFMATEKVTERMLPEAYFKVRELDSQQYYPDYEGGWHLCDKEIIAEDYRVLFAPSPYNENHAIIEKIRKQKLGHNIIELPSESVKNYISCLNISS